MAKSLVGKINFLGFTLRPSLGLLYYIEEKSQKTCREWVGIFLSDNPMRFRRAKSLALRFLLHGMGYSTEQMRDIHLGNINDIPDIDWADLMHIGLGFMGYKPKEFWRMTMLEFQFAYAGFCEFHNVALPVNHLPATSEELADLLKRFPDTNIKS